MTNTAKQSVRTLRIQVYDGICVIRYGSDNRTYVNDTGVNLAAPKDKAQEALQTANPNIATSKDFNLIRFHHLVWPYIDNTNDAVAPVKRPAAPTVETRLWMSLRERL